VEWQPQLEAFCSSHDVATPQLRLRDVAHWAATMPYSDRSSETSLHDEEAYIAPGYFYLPVSDWPDEEQIGEWGKRAHAAHWLLVPSVLRPDSPGLLECGTVLVPFMQVAYFQAAGSVDACLKEAVGSRQYSYIVRRTVQAEKLCTTEFYRLSELGSRPWVIDDFAALQASNVAKYKHSKNLYSAEVLHALARSSASRRYFLKMNYDQPGGVPLYGSLSYADDSRGVFSQLVQGQDRSKVPTGLNLYLSDYYQWYRFAEEMGFEIHCLGRGAIQAKERVGANHVADLVNALVPMNTNCAHSMVDYVQQLMRQIEGDK
jgi:hypothetical protein